MAGILSLNGISKRFPGVLALDDVPFEARDGEVHAVMGENGAGKSTLMKIVAGIHRPDAGTVKLGGRTVAFRSPQEASAAGIRTVFQELTVLPNRDVAHNIMIGREPAALGGMSVDRRALYAEAKAVLERLGIAIDPRAQAGHLSAGQRQMVEIARACLETPKVLILDEPTSSLGREEELLLFRLVRQLRDEGVAIVYITHRMSEVFELSDRITVLRDGRFVVSGPVGEFTRESLIRAMVGRDVAERRHGADLSDLPVAMTVRDLQRQPVVRGVDLTLRSGEVLGVAGLMGSGRTELARLMAGIDMPDSGQITLNGAPFAPRHVGEAIDAGVAYVSEDRKALGLLLPLTVADNIALPSLGALSGPLGLVRRGRLRALAAQWMTALNVKAPSPDTVINMLSGGNQQKVVLAKWLSTQPRIILLDEPTRGVDVGAKAEIYDKIRSLAADGVAVMVISSELSEIIALSDRIAVMAQGRIAGIVDGSSATEEALLELAFQETGDQAA
ncbi:MAG: sugar ABC transporter ATP-binding protein [Phyllobacteriaceae bacterium]|jgi:ABC-type sugar transport system ATPase subunit|nr:sugar ABC transporter ATP-binding protein [Phyllobacteriaceae bacterium]